MVGGGGQTLTRGNGCDKTVMFRTFADSEGCCGSLRVYLLSGMLNFLGFVLLPACFSESRIVMRYFYGEILLL